MKSSIKSAPPFRLVGFAVFGDEINNVNSSPATFEIHGRRFQSAIPVHRADGANINSVVTQIREAMERKP